MPKNTEDVEFDILVNGKQAKKSLQDLEKDFHNLEKQDERTTKSIKTNWAAVGASIAAAAATLGIASKSATDLERATFGLNQETKDYIRTASELYGVNQTLIAGFVRSANTAGITGDSMKKLVDTAIALGRAYPHESTETLVDNLIMLNRTGEAQGFIVDILEQKYRSMDTRSLSLSQKMQAVEEVAQGINEEFNKTAASKVDKSIIKIQNAFTGLGNSMLELADETGIFTLVDKAIKVTSIGFKTLEHVALGAKKAIAFFLKSEDLAEATDAFKRSKQELDRLKEELFKGEEEEQIINLGEVVVSKEAQQKAIEDIDRFMEIVGDAIASLRRDLTKGEITPEQLLFAEDQVIAWADKVQKGINRGLSMEEAMEATRGALETMKKDTEEWEKFGANTFSTLEDAFIRFAQTGKLSVKEMANSIIADLIRIQVQKAVVGSLGGITGALGGLFGFHTGTSEVKHTGGSIGGGQHIPSYHTGMRTDERMAKLQVGEAIINRAGARNNPEAIDAMNRGQKIGNGGDTYVTHEHTWNVTTPDAGSFAAQMIQNKDIITGIIQKDVLTNGSTRTVLKQAL